MPEPGLNWMSCKEDPDGGQVDRKNAHAHRATGTG